MSDKCQYKNQVFLRQTYYFCIPKAWMVRANEKNAKDEKYDCFSIIDYGGNICIESTDSCPK